MKRFYSLPEVAAETRMVEHLKDPERWLADQIRGKRVRATKIGRSWFMSDEQVDAMFADLENKPAVQQVVEMPRRGPSAASLRRRAS